MAGRRASIIAVVAVLLIITSVGLAVWAISARNDANLATEELQKARAAATYERELARLATVNERLTMDSEETAGAQLRVADSRRIAALSQLRRGNHLDRALILAVEAIDRENTLESRSSLLDALLTEPRVTAFLHRSGGDVTSVAFRSDGKTLAVGYGADHRSGGVVLRNTQTLAPFDDKASAFTEGNVTELAFSPDGSIIAASFQPTYGLINVGGAVLWDARTGKRLTDKPLAVTEGSAYSIAFSPNGETLAAGYDGGVLLWDARLRRRLGENPLYVCGEFTTRLAFSPNGKTLAVGYSYSAGRAPFGDVALVDVDLESWKNRARKIANRNLTGEEWRQFFPDTPYHATFNNLPAPPEERVSDTSRPEIGESRVSNNKQ